jgi:hypothetical protein
LARRTPPSRRCSPASPTSPPYRRAEHRRMPRPVQTEK